MFVDTYYDSPEDRENVQDYEDYRDGKRGDPFTTKDMRLHHAIQNPREYWLEVLKVRVLQVLKEWYEVVVKVKESIEDYVSYSYFIALFYILFLFIMKLVSIS